MDVKDAYLQSNGFDREIYVRPPHEANKKGILWNLEATEYKLVESGRLWYLKSKQALIVSHGLKRSTYDHTLYYAHIANGNLEFMLATQVDEYLYTGTEERMKALEQFLKASFEVTKLARSNRALMGCVITRSDDGSIKMSETETMAELDPQELRDVVINKKYEETAGRQATL